MIPMAVPDATRTDWASAQLMVDASTFFDQLLEAINRARHSVDLEYYIFALDSVGERFIEAMGAAAARGVRVRLLVDGVGSAAGSETLAQRLFELGVAVQIYHPLPWLTGSYRWSVSRGGWLLKFLSFLLNLNRRNHRKLCLIDGERAWVGSLNISSDHLAREQGGKGWRDYALALRGRGVESLQKGFERLWSARDPRFHRGFFHSYLSNRSNRARRLKNRFLSDSVRDAGSRVWIVSAYFAPTGPLRRELLSAAKRGVDVCLLLPEHSDVAIFPGLSSHYYRELLRSGARIFLYQPGVLHAKAVLLDDLAILGSSNLNYRSTLHDLELDVLVDSPETVSELRRLIQLDRESSRELLLEHTPPPRLLDWLWYLLRYWM